MFRFFERQVDPYPDAPPATPPKSFFAFLWQASEGVRPWMLATTLLTAAIGAFEAYLFSMMGSIVDWLSTVPPADLWTAERERLMFLGAVLAGSVLLVVLQSTIKQQVIFGNFPMLLRWKFHRLMLGQSMAFYQDEFAGRIATKVMQTALAVREVWLIVAEMLVFVTIYFVTLLSVLVWVVVTLSYYLAFFAFDLHLPIQAGVLLLVLTALAVMAPSAPGFVGPFEWAAIYGMMFFESEGVTRSVAASYALYYHAIQFVPITLLGLYHLRRERFSLTRAVKEEPPEAQP